jgi:hypothetical protein
VRALVPIAANGGKDPEVIDAAAYTFLHEGRSADFRCINHSLRSASRSGHSDLPGWLLCDFEVSDFCAPSRLKSGTCSHKPFSDQFKWIEMGCHLS